MDSDTKPHSSKAPSRVWKPVSMIKQKDKGSSANF